MLNRRGYFLFITVDIFNRKSRLFYNFSVTDIYFDFLK